MAAELPAFDLQRALRFGLVPLVVGAADPAEVLVDGSEIGELVERGLETLKSPWLVRFP